MPKKPHNQLSIDIKGILSSCSRISDVRYINKRDEIIYLTSTNGVGELYRVDKSGNEEKLSKDLNVRGTIGYGGGGFDASPNLIVLTDINGDIYKINLSTNRTIKIASNNSQTASPKISPDGKWVIFVNEQNESAGIGILSLAGFSSPRQLVLGADFYMHPTWHPNGELVAWAEWDHPYMPWDASCIKIGQLGGKGFGLLEEEYFDGKINSSANQPQFSPDGKWLSYIRRDGNWDNLILYNLETKKKKIIIKGDGYHLRIPDWIQGLHSYRWMSSSKRIYFIKYHHGKSSISYVDIDSGEKKPINIAPYIWASQIDVSEDSGQIVFLGSSNSSANQIVKLKKHEILPNLVKRKSKPERIPKPSEIVFPTSDGSDAYAWLYPAAAEHKDAIPPCIINIHSGPTSLKHPGFSAETTIFTSLGFSIAYLNYRGSISYGYDYQYALRRRWGEAEVEDAFFLIRELISQKLVKQNKIAVMGSSAGGFTVLHLLIKHPGMFKAGICSYGVSDLIDDAQHTHKFERYYHQFLTGDFTKEKDRFIDRSPITHLDKISDPLALFHGEEDRVVSPGQSQKIYENLSERNIPCILKIYPGEGHGFRLLENIGDYYHSSIQFLRTYMEKEEA